VRFILQHISTADANMDVHPHVGHVLV